MNRKTLAVAPFIALLLALAACEKEPDAPPAVRGAVKASPAYIEHFGQPPTPEEGICYARVGFFALRSEPDKVRAVPFFLFSETDQLEKLLERLVSRDVPLLPESGLFNPFPESTSVEVRTQVGDTVSLNLHFGDRMAVEPDMSAIVAVLTETAVQFEGIERVVILREGKSLPAAPEGGFQHDPARVASVKEPVLFMVVASWEKGQGDPEEIAANFDRPVKIGSFRLEDADGQEIAGDYFQSVFNMSVIIHPEDPARIREGMILQARWEVVDELGRKGKGRAEFPLQRFEHPVSEVTPH